MLYNDDYFIAEIRAGGVRQEQAIKKLYEQDIHMVRYGRKKYRTLDDEDLITAYNSSIIALRRQLLTGTFRRESSLSTYLNRIFSNKCIDLLRQKTGQWLEYSETVPEKADDNDILSSLEQSEQLKQAIQYLEALGDVCKQILMDSEYWGYNSEEIAERIGFASANSVNSKKYSCLQKLRQMLVSSSS